MGPIEDVLVCLRKYATFRGRASPSEFWSFALFNLVGLVIALWISRELLADYVPGSGQTRPDLPILLWTALTIAPLLSVTVRRAHDRGYLGIGVAGLLIVHIALTVLLLFVLAGGGGITAGAAFLTLAPPWALLSLVLAFVVSLPPDPGRNKYGPNPHEVSA